MGGLGVVVGFGEVEVSKALISSLSSASAFSSSWSRWDWGCGCEGLGRPKMRWRCSSVNDTLGEGVEAVSGVGEVSLLESLELQNPNQPILSCARFLMR